MAGRVWTFLVVFTLTFRAASALAEAASYTLREGETIFGIARKTGIPAEVLCTSNGIDNPGRVKAGTPIRLPVTYTVKRGDTLWAIARAYSVTVQKLLALNRLTASAPIKPGSRLYLPPGSTTSPPAASAAEAAQGKAQETQEGAPPAAAGESTPAARPRDALVWPHNGKHEPWTGKVTGLIFHGNRQDRVLSASRGEVKWVGPYWGYGKTILIKGDDGLVYMYAGNEDLLVNVGDRVTAGTEIARLGVSPQGRGAVLYFSIQGRAGQFVDPEKYITQG
jgi:murein DD-endopeptidase MepM/ murein hydrolase activator NlpD